MDAYRQRRQRQIQRSRRWDRPVAFAGDAAVLSIIAGHTLAGMLGQAPTGLLYTLYLGSWLYLLSVIGHELMHWIAAQEVRWTRDGATIQYRRSARTNYHHGFLLTSTGPGDLSSVYYIAMLPLLWWVLTASIACYALALSGWAWIPIVAAWDALVLLGFFMSMGDLHVMRTAYRAARTIRAWYTRRDAEDQIHTLHLLHRQAGAKQPVVQYALLTPQETA